MAYSKNWKLVDVFSIAQAAYLWTEREPPLNAGQEIVRGGRPGEVAAIIQALEAAILLEDIRTEMFDPIFKDCFNVPIRREELILFARLKSSFPSFLFETLADDRVAKDEPSQLKNLGGRPARHDWDGCTAEIVRIADEDGLPIIQNDLVREIQKWFRDTHDREPAESEIKKRVSTIYKSLKDRGWKPRDG